MHFYANHNAWITSKMKCMEKWALIWLVGNKYCPNIVGISVKRSKAEYPICRVSCLVAQRRPVRRSRWWILFSFFLFYNPLIKLKSCLWFCSAVLCNSTANKADTMHIVIGGGGVRATNREQRVGRYKWHAIQLLCPRFLGRKINCTLYLVLSRFFSHRPRCERDANAYSLHVFWPINGPTVG